MAMKNINELVHSYQNNPVYQTQPQRQAPAISERDAAVVNMVFEQLQAIFPAWKRAFPTQTSLDAARSEWTKALVQAGCVTDSQLSHGFRVARESDIPFFPSPGMFIKWCQPTPESLGLPSVEQALHEVSRHRATHPAVILAARATRFERETLSASEYAPVFTRAYEVMVERVMRGEDLEAEVLKGLPQKNQIQHSPEFYQEAGQRGVSKLRALFKRGMNYEPATAGYCGDV